MKLKQNIFIKFDIDTPFEDFIYGLLTVKNELEKIGVKPVLYEETEIFLTQNVDFEREEKCKN